MSPDPATKSPSWARRAGSAVAMLPLEFQGTIRVEDGQGVISQIKIAPALLTHEPVLQSGQLRMRRLDQISWLG